jgi:hypothetical protein
MSDRPDGSHSGRSARQLILLMLLTLIVPFSVRALNARYAGEAPATYLPALEGPRVRGDFDSVPIEQLAYSNPGIVIIGDSMAGTRIDYRHLAKISGWSTMPLVQAGSGPAFWYLALKNWVIASGVKPRVVFIFFRDTNLTNVMFRLDEGYRWNVDRAAHDREEELDAVVAARRGAIWTRMGAEVEELYGANRARLWVEPSLSNWVGRVMIPSRRQRTAFMAEMNSRFDYMHVRPNEAADVEAAIDREADFEGLVDRSVLPLMLRDAKRAGLTLCFVRVQRRPIGNRPPPQSPALQRYVSELQQYIEAHGGLWRDDTGDPAMTLDMYEDGDHLAQHSRRYYTEIFYSRMRHLLQP